MHNRPGHLIRRAQQVHAALWLNMVSRDVTPTQFSALSVIAAHSRVDQVTVSREASLDTSTTGAVIERLIQRGWVLARNDPADRRRRLLSLTSTGVDVHRAVWSTAEEMTRRLTGCFEPAEQEQFVELLSRFVEHGEHLSTSGAGRTPPAGFAAGAVLVEGDPI